MVFCRCYRTKHKDPPPKNKVRKPVPHEGQGKGVRLYKLPVVEVLDVREVELDPEEELEYEWDD
jgi:hypothetical protein